MTYGKAPLALLAAAILIGSGITQAENGTPVMGGATRTSTDEHGRAPQTPATEGAKPAEKHAPPQPETAPAPEAAEKPAATEGTTPAEAPPVPETAEKPAPPSEATEQPAEPKAAEKPAPPPSEATEQPTEPKAAEKPAPPPSEATEQPAEPKAAEKPAPPPSEATEQPTEPKAAEAPKLEEPAAVAPSPEPETTEKPTPKPESPKTPGTTEKPTPALTGLPAEGKPAGTPPKTGPEKTLIPIDVPAEYRTAPATGKAPQTGLKGLPPVARTDESPRTAVRRTRTDQADARGEFSNLSRDQLEDRIRSDQYRFEVLLQQLEDMRRTQKTDTVSPIHLKSARLAQIVEGIEESRKRAQEPHPAVRDAFPGDDPQTRLERADFLFRLGYYALALRDYHDADRGAEKTLDDADRAWIRFQKGVCEEMLQQPERASSRLEEVNQYFAQRGYRTPEQIENKLRHFDEDSEAVLTWSTGFWRRRADMELQNLTANTGLVETRQGIEENMAELRKKAGALLLAPEEPATGGK